MVVFLAYASRRGLHTEWPGDLPGPPLERQPDRCAAL